MARFLRRIALMTSLSLCFLLLPKAALAAPLEDAPPMNLTAPSAILLEAETGAVIFEKNADEERPVASVTKLMTLLLILEKLESGQITLEDKVTVSEYAAGQSGSQAFLDAHAVYPLKDLLKATIISSGNDSAVALAEYVAGTEEAFVSQMNEKAEEMELLNTHYVNCTGLPTENQHTTARDVGMISREICRYPDYFSYSSTWLDSLTHPSGRVTDLTNTNRLVRFYQDCDGLKTGSTNEAKYCLSATAERKGMRLIAVVLGVPNSQTRFDEARAMMEYGFANYARVQVAAQGDLIGAKIPVKMGSREEVDVALGSGLGMLLKNGQAGKLRFETQLPEFLQAPVEKGQEIGMIRVLLGEEIVAQLPALAAENVRLPGMLEGFHRLLETWK